MATPTVLSSLDVVYENNGRNTKDMTRVSEQRRGSKQNQRFVTMPDQHDDVGKIPTAAVLLNKNKNTLSNYNSRDKDKVHMDYVKQAKRDSNNAHGDSVQIKGLLTNISREKKMEGEVMNRYYESRTGFQPKQMKKNGRTPNEEKLDEVTMAQLDAAMLKTGLKFAQEKKRKVKPQVDTKSPFFQKYFVENMKMAEKVRQGLVTIDPNINESENVGDLEYRGATSHRVDSAPSNYTMLSSKAGEPNTEKVKIVHGHWVNMPSSVTALPKGLQTDKDKDMEQKWKQYLAIKKYQKSKKKQDELLNINLSPEQRIKHLEPVDMLCANIKTQSIRFRE